MYTFQDLKAKMYNSNKKKPFGTWKFDKNDVLVNLIIQKWKSKHLVWLSFSSERLNLRELRGFILQKVQA